MESLLFSDYNPSRLESKYLYIEFFKLNKGELIFLLLEGNLVGERFFLLRMVFV